MCRYSYRRHFSLLLIVAALYSNLLCIALVVAAMAYSAYGGSSGSGKGRGVGRATLVPATRGSAGEAVGSSSRGEGVGRATPYRPRGSAGRDSPRQWGDYSDEYSYYSDEEEAYNGRRVGRATCDQKGQKSSKSKGGQKGQKGRSITSDKFNKHDQTLD